MIESQTIFSSPTNIWYFFFQDLDESVFEVMEYIQCIPDLPDLADLADFFIHDEESQDFIANFDDNNSHDPPQS